MINSAQLRRVLRKKPLLCTRWQRILDNANIFAGGFKLAGPAGRVDTETQETVPYSSLWAESIASEKEIHHLNFDLFKTSSDAAVRLWDLRSER